MKNITDFLASDKGETLLTVGLILLVGIASFGLGRLSVLEQETHGHSAGVRIGVAPELVAETEPSIESDAIQIQTGEASLETYSEGEFVASKNGKAYHYPWCPGAKQISEQNKIFFPSRSAAEAAGYKPAANCKGL